MQQASLYRRERQTGVKAVLLFVVRLRKSARSAGDTGVSFVWIDRVSLDVYSPADNAEDAEECSKLHYHAEKDS